MKSVFSRYRRTDVPQPWLQLIALVTWNAALGVMTASMLWPEMKAWNAPALAATLGSAGYFTEMVCRQRLDRARSGPALIYCLFDVALWSVLPLALVTGAVVIMAFGLPPYEAYRQALVALWRILTLGALEFFMPGPYEPGGPETLLRSARLPGLLGLLGAGWACFRWTCKFFHAPRFTPPVVAGLMLIASSGLALALQIQEMSTQALYFAPAQAWPFAIGVLVATQSRPVAPPLASGAITGALSVYLWCWPFYAAAFMLLARPPGLFELVLVLTLALFMAWATVVFLRWLRGRLEAKPWKMVLTTALVWGAAGCAAATMVAFDGFPFRSPPGFVGVQADALVSRAGLNCHVENAELPPLTDCIVRNGRPPEILVWGNSHAAHQMPAIDNWARGRDLTVGQMTKSGCLTVLEAVPRLVSRDCVAFNRLALDEITRIRPRIVVIGAAWSLMSSQAGTDQQTQVETVRRALDVTVSAIEARAGPGVRIVVLTDTPSYEFRPAACHDRRAFLNLDPARCDRGKPSNYTQAMEMTKGLVWVASRHRSVILFDPRAGLCRADQCLTRGPNGEAWYMDQSHLTIAGGEVQSAAFARTMSKAGFASLADQPR